MSGRADSRPFFRLKDVRVSRCEAPGETRDGLDDIRFHFPLEFFSISFDSVPAMISIGVMEPSILQYIWTQSFIISM